MARNKKIWFPEVYQHDREKRSYFEGWYFRHISKDLSQNLCVIPGISIERDDQHAFIQVIIGPLFKTYYLRFDIADAVFSSDALDVTIGNSKFSLDGVSLDISTDDLSLKGEISYGQITRIDCSVMSPNIMGYFAYLKSMQCNHGVISLRHDMNGKVAFNGEALNFDGGRGYLEKDWGTSFPKEYIWVQCNTFEQDVDLFFSVAHIPFLSTAFQGFISVIRFGDKQYRFATYNGAKLKIDKQGREHFIFILKRKQMTLVIDALMVGGQVLKAPKEGIMIDEIAETLIADITVSLYEHNKLLTSVSSKTAGMEVVGY